jgi:Spy/CpxP family protein refolding chaperone
MPGMKSLKALAVAAMLAAGSCACAADSKSPPGKPLKMDEPMHGEMKKKNMKKGDVKKAAEKKDREMKLMMEKETMGGATK